MGAGDSADGRDELADDSLAEDGNRLVRLERRPPDAVQRHVPQAAEARLLVGYVEVDRLDRAPERAVPLFFGVNDEMRRVSAKREHPVALAEPGDSGPDGLDSPNRRVPRGVPRTYGTRRRRVARGSRGEACRTDHLHAGVVRREGQKVPLFAAGADLRAADPDQHLAGAGVTHLEGLHVHALTVDKP